MSNELQLTIKEIGVPQQQAKTLLDNFGNFFVEAHKLTAKSKAIKVTSEDQLAEMKEARELRLKLRKIRVEADKTRVVLKEGYLRGGQAVQRIFNDIRDITKPEEERLLEQEKFAERIVAENKNRIEKERRLELSKYVDDVEVFSLHPDQLSTESYNKLLATSKESFEIRRKAEEEAEKKRIAEEKAERERIEKIRKENEKLRKEAEQREKELAKQRAIEVKKLEAERKKREALEAKIKAEKEAKERLEREAEEKAEVEAKKILLAPDKEKLELLVKSLMLVKYPALSSKEAKDILDDFIYEFEKNINTLRSRIKKL